MKKVYLLKICLLLVVVAWCSSSTWGSDKTTFFAADSPEFQYMGRVAIDEGEATYNWPGVTVAVDFSGKLLGIRLHGGERNYFNVWVDDYPEQVVHAESDTVWWFPERLSRGQHQLRLVKRTEADMGTAVFYGLHLGEKENLIQPAALPERKLLFIGNSITCGYGTEGGNRTERFKPSTENCEKSYAPIMARAFNAQYHLISHSGLGMVRNYGDPEKISVKLRPMPARLDYLLDNDSTRRYDLNNYQPDAVVVNLGTNDFSTQPFPDEADFVEAGKALVHQLLAAYPGVKIFCITGPMMDEPAFTYTKRMVHEVRVETNSGDVVFLGVPRQLLNPETDLGSDSHPSYRGQLKTAGLILPVMGTVLNWDFSMDEMLPVLKSH
ncbi:GDSL-type esterase/lipase family protein [Sunxiuqinia sp. sy24]|uniref:GDSL-type esterase/lipase family protein n=1 Tax=Sunxiuqinia sp. sy24 TaxID=3461495 RepID=UPI0040462141